MVELGDIIERDSRYWAVRELIASTPQGFPADALIDDGDGTVLRVSTAGLEAVGSATFTAGQRVRMPIWHDITGTVVADHGDEILVTDDRPCGALGIHAKRTYTTPINRGALTAANLAAIIKALELN